MKLLLDTHILIWTLTERLPADAVSRILDPSNTVFFSSASIWEVAIKKSNRPDTFAVEPSKFYQHLLNDGYLELNVTAAHGLLTMRLPSIHRDPFDRILIAQAVAIGATLMTADDTVAQYPANIIRVKKPSANQR